MIVALVTIDLKSYEAMTNSRLDRSGKIVWLSIVWGWLPRRVLRIDFGLGRVKSLLNPPLQTIGHWSPNTGY